MHSDLIKRIEAAARAEARLEIIPARRFVNDKGQTVYSKVREGTTQDLPWGEADCALCHGFFAVIDLEDLRATPGERHDR